MPSPAPDPQSDPRTAAGASPAPVVVISGYRLLRGLGRGNTSRVYLAEKVEGGDGDEASPGRVALKVPRSETLDNRAAAERFGNEVRLSLQFRHPQLVAGLEGVPFGPGAFLAMRYYPGGTLARELAATRPGGVPEALRILADVASGLAYLHRSGAVHQDVKPQNVYLGGGRAALGDFGSTYLRAQGSQVSGSPFYMAPEVYHGVLSGPPSDVYSFGVLAHELLAGERPHRGESYEELMISHLTHFPAPLSRPELPRSLSRLLDQSLAKRPEERPEATLLRQALLEALGEPDHQFLGGLMAQGLPAGVTA
ncbi:MAG: serine/threonine-protein kinase, partial [Deinococcus sp.]